jgi:hypothetical protein
MDESATAFMHGVLEFIAGDVIAKAVQESDDKSIIGRSALRAALMKDELAAALYGQSTGSASGGSADTGEPDSKQDPSDAAPSSSGPPGRLENSSSKLAHAEGTESSRVAGIPAAPMPARPAITFGHSRVVIGVDGAIGSCAADVSKVMVECLKRHCKVSQSGLTSRHSHVCAGPRHVCFAPEHGCYQVTPSVHCHLQTDTSDRELELEAIKSPKRFMFPFLHHQLQSLAQVAFLPTPHSAGDFGTTEVSVHQPTVLSTLATCCRARGAAQVHSLSRLCII